MLILGIETSCDETAAAVVKDGAEILSNVVASSAAIHKKTGGIIPEQAARQQIKSIIPVISEAISEALTIKPSNHASVNSMAKWLNGQIVNNIDAIAVTAGPGLIGSLLVGVETAKALSFLWEKPLVPVNHLSAHIYANWLHQNSKLKAQSSKLPKFPALALVVSGGHTDLVLMRDHGKLKWIGGTRDDAAGEAFDKTARLLGLTYPGGPAISAAAENFHRRSRKLRLSPISNFQLNMFPRPMINEKNYDWSFSGLKTAVLKEVSGKSLKAKDKQRLAAEIQEAIVDVLVEKTLRAAKIFKPTSLLLSGGVAANKRLTKKFIGRIKDEKLQVTFHVPHTKLCTDNATYIASYAHFNFHPIDWREIKADPGLTIVSEI